MIPYRDDQRIIFFGKYNGALDCFSAFNPAKFFLEDVWWPSVEHYYQAHKVLDEKIKEQIRNCETPEQAKKIASIYYTRPDWLDIKVDIMYQAFKAMFEQNPKFKAVLLSTGNKNLHQDDPADFFWGYRGKDKFGQILTRIRTELR